MARWPTIFLLSAMLTAIFGFSDILAGMSDVAWNVLLFLVLTCAFSLMWRPSSEKPLSR
ncbi:MAG: DUF1328 domain-containing protein [Planctomycetes bacterium]|nr:DUF1328 domain-containing protein [Planctomycetota bacterium]